MNFIKPAHLKAILLLLFYIQSNFYHSNIWRKKQHIKTILPFFLRPKTVVSFKAISIKIFYQIYFLFYRTAFASLLFYLVKYSCCSNF